MPVHIPDKNTILKNFAIGLIPLFAFILADELYGTETGLLVGILSGVAYAVYYYIRFRQVEKFILFDTALIIVLGGISLLLNNEIFFKLKPALVELILVALVGIHAFSDKPILTMMGKRYMGDMPTAPAQAEMLKKLSRLLFVVLLGHTALIVYSAWFWSKEAWAFISGGLFYILFAIIFIGQWIYLRIKKKAAPRAMHNAQEEWFDIVDESGKIQGRAPRSAVHGNPELLHPTVHLHVFNRRGQLYLQKRASNKDLFPGKWDTAVGGHIASGESVEQALLREAEEELGIDASRARPLYRYIMRNAYESELVHTFKMLHNGPFRLNREEIEEGRFWNIFEIKRMLGKDIFTPNFEQEFAMLEKTGAI